MGDGKNVILIWFLKGLRVAVVGLITNVFVGGVIGIIQPSLPSTELECRQKERHNNKWVCIIV